MFRLPSKCYKYYDENERKIMEAIPKDLLPTDQNRFSVTAADKVAMRKFLSERTYILDLISEKEKSVISLFYGLTGQDFLPYRKIGEKLGMSHEMARQFHQKALFKLRQPNISKFFNAGLTDDDFWGEMKPRETIYRERLKEMKESRDGQLSLAEQEADDCLEVIFETPINTFFSIKDTIRLRLKGLDLAGLLCCSQKQIEEFEFEDIAKKVHALGLHFTFEAGYEKEWLALCHRDIKTIGVNNIYAGLGYTKNNFNLDNNSDFNNLLLKKVEDVGFSVRTNNCVKRSGLNNVKDLICMKQSEYSRIMGMGPKILDEIIKKITSMGLDICPESCSPSVWVSTLRKKFVSNIKVDDLKNQPSIIVSPLETMPKEYRKSYVVGVGARAYEQIQKNRLVPSMLNCQKKSYPAKLPRKSTKAFEIENLTDKQILSLVAENLELIKDLEEMFVQAYKFDLICLVRACRNVDKKQAENYIKIINNASKTASV